MTRSKIQTKVLSGQASDGRLSGQASDGRAHTSWGACAEGGSGTWREVRPDKGEREVYLHDLGVGWGPRSRDTSQSKYEVRKNIANQYVGFIGSY